MTEFDRCHWLYWTSLDQCLHRHRAVVSSDLRLLAAHAAFQMQLATFRVLRPAAADSRPAPDNKALRASLEALLREVSVTLLRATPDLVELDPAPALERATSLEDRSLLLVAEDTVRYLRDHPSLWSGLGLAALQVRALADLQSAFALEQGDLLPSAAPAGTLDDRAVLAILEITRLLGQELDHLVDAHESITPALVEEYRRVREQVPQNGSSSHPRWGGRTPVSPGTASRPKVPLPN